MWLLLWRARRLPLDCQTLYATLRRHFSPMICLLPPSPTLHPPATRVLFFFFSHVSPSKCLLCLHNPGTPAPSPISICTIQALQLTNLLFIVAQRPLCSSLCRACCPLSRSCSGSPHSKPCSHILTTSSQSLPQTAIMCLSAAQRATEWRLFSIPPAIYLTLSKVQVKQRHRAQSSHVCDGRAAALPAGPPPQAAFQRFNFTYGGWKTYKPGVFATPWVSV